MTTIDLKNLIIRKINQIEDDSFLDAIHRIISSKADEQSIVLSDSQKYEIREAKKQIANGESVQHDSLMQEIDKWLENK
jgi:predicted transcriptional regulator